MAGTLAQAPAASEHRIGPRAPLGPTLALTVALAIGLFVLVLGPALILTSPTPLPPPLGEQEQDVESALYVAVFAMILPVALIGAPRLADSIAAGPNAGVLSLLVAFVVATLAVAILVVRTLPGGGSVVAALGCGRPLVAGYDRCPHARDTGASVDTTARGRPSVALRLGAGRRALPRCASGLHLFRLGEPAAARAGRPGRSSRSVDLRSRWHRPAARSASVGGCHRRVGGRPLLAGRT